MSGFVPWIPVEAATERRLAVKDVIDVAGWPTGAGHPRWLDTHGIAPRDAEAVARLRAGFTVIGKTHTDELAYSLAGTNAHYGTPVNPSAPDRIPGGSSSGTAVAVAAGEADLGLGTDTGGSIRVPASYTGLYGLRPTHARAPRAGMVPLAPSFDVPGLLARDLGTLRAGTALLLEDAPDAEPARRLWFPADLPIGTATRAALVPAVRRLAEHVELITAPLFENAVDWEQTRAAFASAQAAQVWEHHGDWIREHRPEFGPGVAARLRIAARTSADEADAARKILRHTAATLCRALDRGVVLALPSAPGPPPLLAARHGVEHGGCTASVGTTTGDAVAGGVAVGLPGGSGRAGPHAVVDGAVGSVRATPAIEPTEPLASAADRAALVRLTCLAPVCGAPVVSVPVTGPGGLPLGLSLLAAPGRDETLLTLADLLPAIRFHP